MDLIFQVFQLIVETNAILRYRTLPRVAVGVVRLQYPVQNGKSVFGTFESRQRHHLMNLETHKLFEVLFKK